MHDDGMLICEQVLSIGIQYSVLYTLFLMSTACLISLHFVDQYIQIVVKKSRIFPWNYSNMSTRLAEVTVSKMSNLQLHSKT